jgi:hypothetical protein
MIGNGAGPGTSASALPRDFGVIAIYEALWIPILLKACNVCCVRPWFNFETTFRAFDDQTIHWLLPP